MATLIGIVSQVVGEVFAVASDGSRRPVSEGDRVYAGEQLVTGATGAVAVSMTNGQQLTLGRDSSITLDAQMLAYRGETQAPVVEAPQPPTDDDLTDVERLQAAIEAGDDPTLQGEATAAGPGAGAGGAGGAGGGNSFVLLTEVGGALDPVIGYPTEGLNSGPEFPEAEPIALADPAVDGIPTGGTASNQVDEEGLPDGIVGGVNDLDGEATQVTGVLGYSFGPDGPGAFVWSTAGLAAMGISSGGVPLTYEVSADGLTLTAFAGATVVFVAQVTDLATGSYQFDLLAALDHAAPEEGGSDENDIVYLFNYTITDGNGTPATGSLSILVDDDSPTLTVGLNEEMEGRGLNLQLDETVGVDREAPGETADGNDDDGAGYLGRATTELGGGGLVSLFTVGGGYGQDGPGSLTGNFYFTGIPAGGELSTNLEATDGGAIVLQMDGDDVVGVDGDGHVVFRLEIVDSATGPQLQTTLYEAIRHDGTTTTFDEALNLLLGDDGASLGLTYEVVRTDGDGDQVTASETLVLADEQGSILTFDDDGPTQNVGLAQGASADLLAMEVDETLGVDRAAPGETADGNGDDGAGYLGRSTTALGGGGLVGLFTTSGDYGQDGAGSVSTSLYFSGIPAGGELSTNLEATDGGAIVLQMDGDDVVGVDGDGHMVFRLEIVDSATGPQLQTTLYEAIRHDGTTTTFDEALNLLLGDDGASLGLTYEVVRTDGDGDQVTASETLVLADEQGSILTFDDDGPTQNVGLAQGASADLLAMEVDETVGVDRAAPGETADGNGDDGAGYLGRSTTALGGGGLVGLFTTSGDYGQDGAGSVSTSLYFSGIPAGGELSTNLEATDGGAIVLQMDGDDVVGVDGDGHVVFRLEIVDSATGPQLQTTLYEAIRHDGTTTTFDEALNLLLGDDGASLGLTYEVVRTDGDGDQVTASETLVLADEQGSILTFDDDGPTQNVGLAQGASADLLAMEVDETVGVDRAAPGETADGNGDDGAGYLGRSTTALGGGGLVGLFTTSGDYGQDGAGSVSTSLYFSGIPAGGELSTNLEATDGGAIVLQMDGDDVVGVDGDGHVVFRLEIVDSATGPQLQTTLYEAIRHDGTTTTFDEALNLLLGDDGASLGLTYEVVRTDGDGDQVTASETLVLADEQGSILTFDDDGPTQNVGLAQGASADLLAMEVDETVGVDRAAPGETADGNGDDGAGYLGRSTTALGGGGLVGLFTTSGDYGQDGAGSVSTSLYFSGIPAGGELSTNLEATDGGAIVLQMDGDDVVGVDGDGHVVFRLEIVDSATGPQLQTTLYEAIRHDGTTTTFDEALNLLLGDDGASLGLTYEVVRTDGDGDQVTASETLVLADEQGSILTFDDDGPTQNVGLAQGASADLLAMEVDETVGVDRAAPGETADGNGDDGAGYLGRSTTALGGGGLVGLFTTSGDYGQDGAGSVSTSLYFSGIPAGGELSTNLEATDGGAIVLQMDGDDVVGVDGDGHMVFRLEIVDSATGPQLQTTLYEAIRHDGTTTTFDEALNLLLGDDGASLGLTYEVVRTDGDGDQVTASETLVLADEQGSILTFDDDGPTQNVGLAQGASADLLAMEVDETVGVDRAAPGETADGNGDDGAGYLGRSTTALGGGGLVGLFTTSGDYGQDGAGSVSTSLYFSGIPAGGELSTNLEATDGGAIVLQMDGDDVVGVDGDGHVVFRLEIVDSATGPQLQTTLYEAIRHDGTTTTFDEALNLLLGDDGASLGLTYEVVRTDGDGDQVTASETLVLADEQGSILTFDDDGPTQNVGLAQGASADLLAMEVDETVGVDRAAPGETADGNGDDGAGYLGRSTTALGGGGLVGLFTTSGDYGQDGAGSVSTSLYFSGIPAGGELSTNLEATDGGAIVLQMDGDDVVGVDGDGHVVFRLEIVDSATGPQLQTTLYEAIRHDGTTTTFDEALNLLLGDDGASLGLTYEVVRTDGDGDQVTASETLVLADEQGSILTFDDDGPTQNVGLAQGASADLLAMEVDETVGVDRAAPGETADGNGDDGAGYLGRSTTALGGGGLVGLFTTSGDYGQDGAGSVSTSLYFSGIPAGGELSTNLEATDGGAIVLQMDGDDVVGVDGDGHVVFRLEIVDSATGPQLQTTLYEAIRHDGTTTTFDEALNLLLGDDGASLGLTYEVVRTDGDGDQVTASETLVLADEQGSILTFDDDGPTQNVGLAQGASADLLAMEVDETVGVDRAAPGETADGNGDDGAGYLGRSTTALGGGGLVGLFTTSGDYGQDGAGSVSTSLYFSGIPAGGELSTNLEATDGGAIVLQMDGDDVVGVDGDGHVVFRLEIVDSATGPQLQTTLYEAIRHDGTTTTFDEALNLLLGDDGASLGLTYEVVRTDGDGDQVTASETLVLADEQGSILTFDDDGPTQNVGLVQGASADLLAMEVDETLGVDRAAPGETADGNGDDGAGYLGRSTTALGGGGLVGLFTTSGDYGQDGAGSVSTSLYFSGIPAGGELSTNLEATDGGAIVLQMDGDDVVGVDGDGHVVFRLEIVDSATGPQLQTTLYEAIRHDGTTTTFDEALNLLLGDDGASLGLTYEVVRTDGDGDQVTASETLVLADEQGSILTFDDDGPTVTPPECAEVEEVNGYVTQGVIEADYGSDGGGFDLSANGGPTADGLFYTVVKLNGVTTLTATVGDASGETFFILTVYDDPDALGNGNNYQLEIVNSRPVTTADFNLTGISAGQPQPSFYVESGEGLAVTLTGNGLVNPSTQGVGVGGNNLIDVGEELHMTFSATVYSAEVDVQKLSSGDELFWQAYDSNDVLVAAGTYTGQGSESSLFSFNLADSDFTTGSAASLLNGFIKLTFGSNDGDYRIQEITLEQTFLPPDLDLSFQIDVVDGDNDTVSTQLDVCFVDDTPTGGYAFDLVDEEGLSGGIIGGVEDDAGAATTVTGSLGYDYGGDGFGSFTWLTDDLPSITSGGQTVEYVVSGNGQVLTAQIEGSGQPVFTVTLTNPATGGFQFQLFEPLDHPAPGSGSVENNLNFEFDYQMVDGNGSPAEGVLEISVDDDSPLAQNLSQSREASGDVNTNLLVVLDVSGSMNSSADFGGLSRLEAAKLAVLELLEQYEAMGDVKVRLVTFASGAAAYGTTWMTVDAAKAAVIGFPESSNSATTNYDAALDTAMSAWQSAGKLTLTDNPGEPLQNVSYFLSDGVPNQPDGSAGINPAEEAEWIDFLNAQQIQSYALGMGPAAEVNDNPPGNYSNNDQLDPIAYDGTSGSNTNAIAVNDFADLEDVLVQTAQATPISGNLTDGVNGFGADGGRVKSVVVNGVTYTFNVGVNPTITGSDGSVVNGMTLNLVLAAGAMLSVNMATGEYSYVSAANVGSGTTQQVGFILIDNDGDQSGLANLTITVDPADGPMVARDDYVISRSSSFDIPDWALLANDGGPNSSIQAITSIVSTAGLTAVHGSSSVAVSSASDGESFVYQSQAGGQTAQAKVTIVDIDNNGSVDGSFLDEILIDSNSGRTLNGYSGDDILIGNGGNDTLNGGDGNDILVGGTGNDTLNGGDGNDTASYIDATSGVNITLNNSGNASGGSVSGWASGDQLSSIENLIGSNFNDTLVGGNQDNVLGGLLGNDTLYGGGGNDVLIGGRGNDTMSGGSLGNSSGQDSFVWLNGDTGIDTVLNFVRNFNAGGDGDRLDLSDLLVGENGSSGDIGNLLDYLQITSSELPGQGTSAWDTTIKISAMGTGDFSSPDQTIVLQDVNLLGDSSVGGYGAGGDTGSVILAMLNDGTLNVDTV